MPHIALHYSVHLNDAVIDNLQCSLHRVVENGTETVTVEENGIIKSITVNGEPQAIAAKS